MTEQQSGQPAASPTQGAAQALVPAGHWVQPAPSPPLVERLPRTAAGRVIVAATAAGLLAQLLFVDQLAGINIFLWVAVVLAAAARLRRPDAVMDRLDSWLPAAALTFAAFVALRDDFALIAFDVLAAGALTLAGVVAIGGTPLTRRGIGDAGVLTVAGVGVALTGALRLGDGVPRARTLGHRRRPILALGRGMLLALPLMLVFGALFAAADAVFAAQLGELLRLPWDIDAAVVRSAFAVVAGWLFAGTMAAAWLSRGLAERAANDSPSTGGVRLGRIETLVLLFALDGLFAAFVLVQAVYLFGGLETLTISGMTYSDYARRGFFELIAVAVLAGCVVLGVDRLTQARGWAYRAAAIGLIGLTGVVLISATVRLGLYQAAYGWTELRFYALAVICLLGVAIVGATVGLLVDRLHRLPGLMVGTGLVIAIGVNLIGPQAFVTERNLERVIEPALVAPGGEAGLDLYYIEFLGNDAIPILAGMRDRLPAAEAVRVDDLDSEPTTR